MSSSLGDDSAIVYRVIDLVKRYKGQERPANDRLTFEVRAGEIFGILGANGAGKSTLVRQMVNLLAPTSGTIEFFGRPLDASVTLRVGYMPQHADALNRLTVEEALYYTAHLRGLSAAEAIADRDALIATWNLESFRRQDSATLSGGQRRLLRIAVAAAGRPDVMILDEPTSDLDPARRRAVWEMLAGLRKARRVTIVFVTHDAEEAERVVDRVAIMRGGDLVAIGTPPALKRVVGRALRVEVSFPPPHPPRLPEGFVPEERAGGRWVLQMEWRDAVEFLRQLAPEFVEDIRVTMPTLEDVFIHHADAAPSAAHRDSIR
jgi:ABC-2 type transport system ATP-binding protein